MNDPEKLERLASLFERLECIWIEMNEAWDHEDRAGALRHLEHFRQELEAHLEGVKKDASNSQGDYSKLVG